MRRERIDQGPTIDKPLPVSQKAAQTAYDNTIGESVQAGNFDAVNDELEEMAKDQTLTWSLRQLSRIRTRTAIDRINLQVDQDPRTRLYMIGAAIVHRALAEQANLIGGEIPTLSEETYEKYMTDHFSLRRHDLRLVEINPNMADLLPIIEDFSAKGQIRSFAEQERHLVSCVDLSEDGIMTFWGAVDTYNLYQTNATLKQPVA